MNLFVKSLSLALLILTLGACSKKNDDRSAMMKGDNKYAVETISVSDAHLSISYPATIKGVQDVEIRAKVAGNIVKQLVDEGDFVKAGQVLFVIDPTQYRAAVEQAKAAVNVIKTNLSTAQLTYNNKKMLREKDIVSQYDLDIAANQLEVLRAQLQQAQAALTNARDQLSFTNVCATSNGVVGSIPYRVGSLVSSASAQALTTVSNLDRMYAYFSMTEKQLLEMTRTHGGINAAMEEMPSVDLLLADGSTYEQKGKVNSVSGVINTSTGSVQMRATFDNPNRILRSGATGTVRFPMAKKGVIVIPQKATYEIQDKKFVYVVDTDNKVHSTEIEVFPQNDGTSYVVNKGLKVGDRIVVEGVNKLRDDMQILPITAAQSAEQLKKSERHMADKKFPGQE